MGKAVVIIDFDNFFGRDMSKINPENLEFDLKEMVNLCVREFLEVEEVQIRLYGGWYKEEVFTNQASELQMLLAQISVFPRIIGNKKVGGVVELATTLHSLPSFTWHFTSRETKGISRIRLDHSGVDHVCEQNRELCPKHILNKFTKSKEKKCGVATCSAIQKDSFRGVEQKMVDTLIACDIITITKDEGIAGVMVISDDQDHLPSLAVASAQTAPHIPIVPIRLCIKNSYRFDFFSSFLTPFGITTLLIP